MSKERIEIQLDTIKDADLISFIDKNGTTRAGFIKNVLRHYMNTMTGNTDFANKSISDVEQKIIESLIQYLSKKNN